MPIQWIDPEERSTSRPTARGNRPTQPAAPASSPTTGGGIQWIEPEARPAGPLNPAPRSAPETPQPSPGTPGVFSSPQGFFGPGIISNTLSRATGGYVSPQTAYNVTTPILEGGVMAAMPGAMAARGAGAVAKAGRALQSGGVLGGAARSAQSGVLAGGTEYAKTRDPRKAAQAAIWNGVLQPAGELAFSFGRYLTSAIPYKLFAGSRAKELVSWFDQNVPSWSNLKSGASASERLHEMALGDGPTVLSDRLYKSLEGLPGVKKRAEGLVSKIPAQLASYLPDSAILGRSTDFSGDVLVQTPALMDMLPKIRMRDKDLYYAGSQRLVESLDHVPGLGAAYQAVSREYKYGAGLIELAKKSGEKGFLAGRQYNAAKAQALVSTHYPDVLGKRGMGEVRDIVRGGSNQIGKDIRQSKPLPAVASELLGTVVGGGLGYGHGGALGGGVGGPVGLGAGYLLSQVPRYRNVPMAPATRAARTVGGYTAGQVGRAVKDYVQGEGS